MNEEEKQAVEKMQYVLDLINKNGEYTVDKKDIKHIIVMTNLIIKYQKEIERLKDEYKRKVFEHQEFVEDTKVAVQDYIKKYKIKELIQEIEKIKKLADEQIKDRKVIIIDSASLNRGYSLAHGKDIDLLKELLGE